MVMSKNNKKLTLFFLSPILLPLFVFTAHHSYQVNHTKNGHDIRVMTYNIRRYGKESSKTFLWENRKKDLLPFLNDFQPDFIGMQEVTKQQLKDIQENLNDYAFFGEFRHPKGLISLFATDEATPIFYKKDTYQLLDHGTFWLNQTKTKRKPGWGAFINRICTWGKFKTDTHHTLWLFNTHLDHQSEKARTEGIKLIIKEINQRTKNNEPVILMGDFNAPSIDPKSPVGTIMFDQQYKMFDTKQNANMVTGESWTAFKKGWSGQTKTIDYILINNPSLFTIVQHSTPTRTDGKRLSDHNPVIVDFSLV